LRSQNNYHETLTLLLDFDVNAQDLHVVEEHLHVVGLDRECGFVIILWVTTSSWLELITRRTLLLGLCLEERELCIDGRKEG